MDKNKSTALWSFFALAAILFFNCTGIISKETLNPNSTSNLDFIYESIDSLFEKYVTADRGLVDYIGIWADPLLEELEDTIAVFDVASLETAEDSLAFWINAYNVLVIYHLEDFGLTPQDQQGFPLFKTKFDCARRKFTLDEIEKGPSAPIAAYSDPRTHFVLVCAALSCPPLINRAYRGDSIWVQLDYKTYDFLNDEEFNPILAQTPPKVSKLFSYYPADFTGYVRDTTNESKLTAQGSAAIKDFIISYINDQNKITKLTNDPSNPISTIDYDWSINTQ